MKTLMNRLILLASLLPGLLFATILNPAADAHVRASTATSNYGALTALYVRTDSALANQYDTYLKFSLGTLSNVTSAKVRLYAKLTVAGSVVTNLHSVADTTWTETDLTWSNKRTLGGVLGTTSVAVTTPAWHEIDITAYVQSELAANRTTISLALHNPNTSQVIQITSKEAASNKPELVITTNTPAASVPAPSRTAPL